ncbi:glycosyltransferase [Micromonospora inositola]|uniref:4,4'-diaponeurosporenoate glycosyltransferase n=1 Tax=Micromonospora inositola TaxID=47865 RepID=A0A1C5JDK1_9ACTN|nr:glycosyltransferase family 2 protein [Micromonospora inositola]SCG68630.1 Glycosyltransferase involved in cell wall bisynthesis [Micromonospora inositola]
MTSIIIAAHNEGAVIGRCLDALLADAAPGEFDVTVVANGCTDRTAAIAAARPGVRVIELAEAGKPAALNTGDEAAQGFPRIYLDADVVLSTQGVRATCAALDGPHLAATVHRELDLAGRPVLVRAYFGIHRHLPVFRDGLFGRGVIGLSEAGRGRFDRFPALVADDLFLDSLFGAAEKWQVESVSSRVATPRRTRDLVRRLSRVRGGNAAMRAAADRGQVGATVRRAARLSWLRDVVLPRPWLAPAALCYVAITVLAALSARGDRNGAAGWARDDSSRQEDPHARVER